MSAELIEYKNNINGFSRDQLAKIAEEQGYPVAQIMQATHKGCLFPNLKNKGGYSYIYLRGTGDPIFGHRLAYFLRYSKIPLSHFDLDHVCNNRNCCNPLHLEAVTQLENINRRHQRGRTAKAEGCANSKFRNWEIAEIRALYRSGIRASEISGLYGDRVALSNLYSILQNKTYKDII